MPDPVRESSLDEVKADIDATGEIEDAMLADATGVRVGPSWVGVQPKQHLCDRFIEGPGDPWAGTYCKLRAQHLGPCSPHYPKEAAS